LVHDTPSRREARRLKKSAKATLKEAQTLAGISEAEELAEQIATVAWKLKEKAEWLQENARLEDLEVVEEPLIRTTKKGERREYLRWICYWREGGRVKKTYIGSCTKMDRHQALEKARALKAKALGLNP
jgi:hypothetical protein